MSGYKLHSSMGPANNNPAVSPPMQRPPLDSFDYKVEGKNRPGSLDGQAAWGNAILNRLDVLIMLQRQNAALLEKIAESLVSPSESPRGDSPETQQEAPSAI